MKKNVLRKILLTGETIFGLLLALVIVVAVFPLLPPFKNYYHSRTVLTGSMEPKIPKGSVVIDQWADQKNLKVGDVITYQHTSDKKITYITHRIVKIDKTGLLWRFETKGDANPASDFGVVTQAGTEGKVIVTIPLIGYLIEFFKTPVGFIVLVALPLLIFIVQQIKDVIRLWPKKNIPIAKKRKGSKILILLLITLTFLAARISVVTYASFTSGQATMTGVTLSTAASFGSGSQPGDVVINELMWMGSTGNSDDQWIELKNTTGNPIDLTGWNIDGAGSGSSSISLSGTIAAHGYFLVSHYNASNSAINNAISVDLVVPGISLNNTGEQLTLKNATDVIIDQTSTGAWAAGVNDIEKQSMERNNDPSTGWHTCLDIACNDTTYWDSEGNNYGTPKAANLSENDPTPQPSPTATPIPTVETTPTPEPTIEVSPTPTPTPTADPTPTPEISPTPTPTIDPSPTPSPSPEPTIEVSPTSSPEPTPTPTDEP